VNQAEESTPEVEERRYPSTIGGAFYLMILGVTVAGIVIAALGHWQAGVRCVSGALVAAALIRLVLPARDAGMLAVRHRLIDASLLAVTGAVLWWLVESLG
jgi:hypothetical protein